MNLGNKIKTLRLKAGLTQEMLANAFNVSYQTISKWENNVCAPDIEMLPRISIYFGISIDELFDLTVEEKFHRIENLLDFEHELPNKTFDESVDFLHQQLETTADKARIYNFLAHVYHHRIVSDSSKVSTYVKKALMLNPNIKNCQWLLQKAEGAAARDWNIKNHNNIIDFYKELVKNNPKALYNYLELLDNLLVDNRIEEAVEYLRLYNAQENHEEYRSLYYEWKIAYSRNDQEIMKQAIKDLEEKHNDKGTAMFLLANLYVEIPDYDKAIFYFAKSFDLDKEQGKNPLYTDALESMALIYQIEGKYDEAIKCYDEILVVLEESFGFTEGEPVDVIIKKKNYLLSKYL